MDISVGNIQTGRMIPATPTGSFLIMDLLLVTGNSTVSPYTLLASAEYQSRNEAASFVSFLLSAIGLPW